MDKIIITAAITGAATVPSQSPYIPITPEQISEEAVKAFDAGAAVAHIHARNPYDGRPSSSLDYYRKIVTDIKKRCNVVICITTGAGAGMSVDERTAPIRMFKPELGSLNLGSMNFSMHPLLKKIKEWKFDWEQQYLENSRDFIFPNSFASLEKITAIMRENETKPELEVYDTSHLYNAKYLIDQGLMEYPLHMQFVLGVMGGAQATAYDLVHLKTTADRLFGANYTWSVVGTGWPDEFRMGAVALTLGGHVRVGLEDNLLVERRELAVSNAQLVAKMRRICEELGKNAATPNEAREMLGLKGLDQVAY